MVNFAASYANNGPSAETLLTGTIEAFHGLCFQYPKVIEGFDRALGRSIVLMISELERDADRPIVKNLSAESLTKLSEILKATGFLERQTTVREIKLADSAIEIYEGLG